MPTLPRLPFETSQRREGAPWQRGKPPLVQYWSEKDGGYRYAEAGDPRVRANAIEMAKLRALEAILKRSKRRR